MRDFNDCDKDELVHLLKEIQVALWSDDDDGGDFWNPDALWSPDTLDEVGDILSDFRPTERTPI